MKRFFVLAAVFGLLAGTGAQAVAQTVEGIHCTEGGQLAFCQWATGCFKIENQYSNTTKPCATLIAECKQDGSLYKNATSPTVINESPYGKDENCGALGFTWVAGKDPNAAIENWVNCEGDYAGYCKWSNCEKISTCTGGEPGSDCDQSPTSCSDAFDNCLSNSNSQSVYSDAACTTVKQSGGGSNGEHCKISGQFAFCGYDAYEGEGGGCYKLQNQYAPNIGKSCDELITECSGGYGTVYTGSTSPSVLDSSPYGDGESCSALGLTSTGGNAVRLINGKTAASGLKVSYAKNRVTVNWTPSTKVSSGTVQLISMKGAAVSTAFIKANSGKVSVKLGTVGVPAGMYFVHINAVGVNGKKIVSQSAISIVK